MKRNRVKIFQIVAFLALAIVIVNYIVGREKIRGQGRYVLGQLYRVGTGGRNAAVSYFHFYFLNRQYTYEIRDGGSRDSFKYIKILPSNPTRGFIVDDIKVPPCITMNQVPDSGWSRIPEVACDTSK